MITSPIFYRSVPVLRALFFTGLAGVVAEEAPAKAPVQKKAPNPAMLPVTDVAGLPRVLLIIARNLLFHPFRILVTLGPGKEGVHWTSKREQTGASASQSRLSEESARTASQRVAFPNRSLSIFSAIPSSSARIKQV